MKSAVVNTPTNFADVKSNLAIAEKYIKDAAQLSVELIVFPEFFTTGFALHPSIFEAIRQSDDVEEQMASWSHQYHIAIGGSYLHYNRGLENVYNTFGLFFPDGNRFFHSKDIPTGIENFCYTAGDNIRTFETPLGNIGIVLCWEQLRWQSVQQRISLLFLAFQ